MRPAFSGITAVPCLSLFFAALASHGAPTPTPAPASPGIDDVYSQLRVEARELSPELKSAEALLLQKRASRYTSLTRWMPRADLKLTQSRMRDYSLITSGQLGTLTNLVPGGFTPTETSLSSWEISLGLPIFRRSIQLGIQQSFSEYEVADAQSRLKLGEFDWRLRQLLGNYLLQLYKGATLQTSLDLARASLREAKARFELGDRTRVDVIRAEANVLSLESKSLTYDQDRSAALSSLIEYTGLERRRLAEVVSEKSFSSETHLARAIDAFTALDRVMPPVEPFLPQGTGPEAFPERLRTEIAERIAAFNPAYHAYVAQEDLSSAQARVAMAQEWPELQLQGSLSKQGPDWSSALEPGNQSHAVALVLSIPIFSGGSFFSTLSEKNNAQRAALLKRERDILALKDEVENEAIQLQALRKALGSQRLNLERNDELVRLSQKTYHLGKSTLLELLSSQNDLIDSKLALAQTKLNTAVLARRFAHNLGVPIE